MGYKKKIYGPGFEVFKKYENWDLAIWHDSMPKALVMMRPVNEKEFIFADIDRKNCSDDELPHFSWFLCDEEGNINEVTTEQAKAIWDDVWDKKKAEIPCNVGDMVYVSDCGFVYDCKVEEIKCENGQVKVVLDSFNVVGFRAKYSARDFGKYVFLTKEERDQQYEAQLKAEQSEWENNAEEE